MLSFQKNIAREVENVPQKIKNTLRDPKDPVSRTDTFLAGLLRKHPKAFQSILDNRDEYRVQIIYSKIDRDARNIPRFTDHYFNVDPDKYFYPASTVKMPVALLALQRLNELKVKGLGPSNTLLIGAAYSGQQEVLNDPTSADGTPSIANYIRKIFLVSDNDAYNRLYEFLGMQYINEQLHQKGYVKAQIRHRLERALSEDENRHTNPVTFLDTQGKPVFSQPPQYCTMEFEQRSDFLGKAHYKNDVLVDGPFDFSAKNRLPLQDLHQIMRSVLFPESVPPKKRFHLSREDLRFLRKSMGQFPGESTFPQYDTTHYWDAYCKFLYWGSEKGSRKGDIRIFNKVGDAYGFLLDIGYVVDFKRKIEFMLSAVIYCNSDGVINDSKYDYDTVGFPFMKDLGQVIYQYERTRKRSHLPDLSAFQMDFQK